MKSHRTVVVALCLVLFLFTHFLLRRSRPVPEYTETKPAVPCTTLPEQSGWVQAVDFSPDSGLLAIGVSEGETRGYYALWDVRASRLRDTLARKGGAVVALRFSHDGRRLALGARDGSVTVCDPESGEERTLRGAGHHRVRQLVFSPDDKTLAAASYHDATVWDLTRGESVPIPGSFPVVFSKEGKPRAANRGDKVPSAISPEGKFLAEESPTAPDVVILWDVVQHRARATLTGHAAAINAAAFSRDSQVVATASNDRTVRLWDVAGGRSRATLTGHTGAVHCVAFSADGQWLASGGFDKTVRLWHLDAMADSSKR